MKNNPARTVMVPEPRATLPTTLWRATQPTASSAKPPARSIPPTHSGSGRSSTKGKLTANAAIKSLKIPPAKVLFHDPEAIGLTPLASPPSEIAVAVVTPSPFALVLERATLGMDRFQRTFHTVTRRHFALVSRKCG